MSLAGSRRVEAVAAPSADACHVSLDSNMLLNHKRSRFTVMELVSKAGHLVNKEGHHGELSSEVIPTDDLHIGEFEDSAGRHSM